MEQYNIIFIVVEAVFHSEGRTYCTITYSIDPGLQNVNLLPLLYMILHRQIKQGTLNVKWSR
jgi:hypothetical protein